MSNKKYVIDDRRPSLLPKIGSAVIAIGSMASVAAIASPGLLPLSQEASSQTDAFGNQLVATAAPAAATADAPSDAPTLPSTQQGVESEGANQSTQAPAESVTLTNEPAPAPLSSTTQATQVVQQASSAPVPVETATQENAVSEPAPTDQSAQSVELPSIPAPGNTSSPTPVAGDSNTNWGTGSSAGTTTGNISSPTPGGGSYYEDDEDDDHHESDPYDDDDDDMTTMMTTTMTTTMTTIRRR
jgi:hypothetical protein